MPRSMFRNLRRHLTLLAASLAFVMVAVAPASAGTLLDEGYESAPSTWTADWWDADLGGRNRVTQISGGVEGKAIKVSIPKGSHFGTAMHYRFADQGQAEPDELWYRYWLRIPEGFKNTGTGKLPGPAGLYSSSGRNHIRPTNSNPGWSARMYFTPPDSGVAGYTDIGSYVYHRGQATSAGDRVLWDTAPARLKHGQWHCVEGRVSMNTPGVSNGVIEGYIDSKLALYEDDFTFLGSGDGGRGVRSFWFDVYYGGDNTAPTSLSFDFDELVLATARIGCGDLPAGSFRDIADSVHADSILRLAKAGITKGCGAPTDQTFCPDGYVTRGQMAAFLVRALGYTDRGSVDFVDDDDSVFEADIEKLATAGVTRGCGKPTAKAFCPDKRVTRGQMAAFLVRALGYTDQGSVDFVDDDDSIFEADIEKLATAGVTVGCNPERTRFCPDKAVTRAQMATFLTRALGLPKATGVPIDPFAPDVPPGYDAFVPAGGSIQATVNRESSGAKILLGNGTHPRQTIVPKSGMTFVGSGSTVIDGQGATDPAFRAFVGGVTLHDLVIKGYDTAHTEGTIVANGNGWELRDVEVSGGGSIGVVVRGDDALIVDSWFHHHDRSGLHVDGSAGTEVVRTEFSHNNQGGHGTNGHAGAQFTAVHNLVVRDSHSHDNEGHGLWTDGPSTGTVLYDNNLLVDNRRSGIYHDKGGKATIRNNTATGNGFIPNPEAYVFFDGGVTLRVAVPTSISVEANTIEANRHGIVILERGNHSGGSAVISVTGNTVTESGQSGVAADSDGPAWVFAAVQFDHNAYRFVATADVRWRHDPWLKTWQQWRDAGQDANGSLTVL